LNLLITVQYAILLKVMLVVNAVVTKVYS